MVDKNQAIIDFLQTCPQIAKSRLFFNFINGQSEDKQIITTANDRSIERPYIDGSVLKRYTFTIVDFRSVIYQPIPNVPNFSDLGTTTTTPVPDYKNKNVEELLDVQGILDWVNEQSEARNYPDFGDDCVIDDMRTTSENPNLNGVDRSVNPALAKYSISIEIDYLDTSKKLMRSN